MTGAAPLYWMHETSGVLRAAVEAYLRDEPMTETQIATMRAYLRQWIAASWSPRSHPGFLDLRLRIDHLTTREAINSWLDDALARGIDPL